MFIVITVQSIKKLLVSHFTFKKSYLLEYSKAQLIFGGSVSLT